MRSSASSCINSLFGTLSRGWKLRGTTGSAGTTTKAKTPSTTTTCSSSSSSSSSWTQRLPTTTTSTRYLIHHHPQPPPAYVVVPPHIMKSSNTSFFRWRDPLLALLFTATTALAYSVADNSNNHHHQHRAYCAPEEKVFKQPFPESALKLDHYQGVTIKLESLCDDELKHLTEPKQFATALEQALKVWEAEGKRGIWIHIPNSMANLVPECANLGFRFHFCQSGTLTMTKWLPDSASRLPLGPSLQAGVGCVVLHPKDPDLVLTVQEKAGPAAAKKLWKMPTGLVDPGEDIMEASIRELKEETGLDATFDGVLCFLQSHRGTGNRATSDMFFVCLLTITSDPDDLKPQESEIADICWMPFSKYDSQETWKKSPVYMELHDAVKEGIAQKRMIDVKQIPVGWTSGNSTVYRPKS